MCDENLNLKRQCAELVSYVENLFDGIYDIIGAQYVASERIKCLNNFTNSIREKLKVIVEYWLVVADQENEDDDYFKVMNEAFDFEVKINLELKHVENFAKQNVLVTSSNDVAMAESKAENFKIFDTKLSVAFTSSFTEKETENSENYAAKSPVMFTSSATENSGSYDTKSPVTSSVATSSATENSESSAAKSLVIFTSSSTENTENHVTKSPTKLIASTTDVLNFKPKVLLVENCSETLQNPKIIIDSVLKSVETEKTEKVYSTNTEFLLHKESQERVTGHILGDHLHGNHTINFISTKTFDTKFGEENELLIEKKENREIICCFDFGHIFENICTNHVLISLYEYKNNDFIENRNCSENDEKIIYVIDDKG